MHDPRGTYILHDVSKSECTVLSERRVIDVHCHRECAAAAGMVKPEVERLGRAPLQVGNELTRELNRRQLDFVRPKMDSVEVRLADMDAMGVDIQALSLSPYQLSASLQCRASRVAFETGAYQQAAVCDLGQYVGYRRRDHAVSHSSDDARELGGSLVVGRQIDDEGAHLGAGITLGIAERRARLRCRRG
jgi:hypothetical protein